MGSGGACLRGLLGVIGQVIGLEIPEALNGVASLAAESSTRLNETLAFPSAERRYAHAGYASGLAYGDLVVFNITMGVLDHGVIMP